MKKNYFSKGLFAVLLVVVLALAACGDKKESEYLIDSFPQTGNEGDVTEGGTLNFGLVTDTAFEGTLNWNFYAGQHDGEILEWFDESLLSVDENFQYTQDGAATFEHTDDYTVWTFTINDDVNWHDGNPVTAEDWLLSYEVIGHADYDGVRWGPDFMIIEGMEAYRAGEADTISGIEVLSEKELQITYTDPTPSLFAGGIWPYAMPKHVFEDIPVAEMSASDAVRQNPIGFGPFKVDSIVSGESVVLKKFEDYWRGTPKLDEVVITVVDPSVVAQELESGNIDVVDAFPTDQYSDNEDMEGVTFLGKTEESYTYIGFNLGTWDKENARVSYEPENSKVGDPALRKAMWYAVDNDAVGEKFYQGLRWAGTTLIGPSHADFHDDTIEAPKFDPEKAKEILDEAGYEYEDGDENNYRLDKDGNELVLNFASMSGGDTAEPLANYYLDAWKDVGLNVQLIDGRLQEFNSFYERIGRDGDDDPEVDLFMGAWGLGADVDPAGLYGPYALFNFSRYESEENTRLLEDGVSEEAFDLEYRQDVYKEWQEFMIEEVPVFPTLYRAELVPVNDELLNYTIDNSVVAYRHKIGFK